jgi:hypothetical protein
MSATVQMPASIRFAELEELCRVQSGRYCKLTRTPKPTSCSPERTPSALKADVYAECDASKSCRLDHEQYTYI